MRTLIFESRIDCSVAKLYAFHADPQNLPAVTPPGITVRIEQMPDTFESGSTAVLIIKRGFLGFRWHLRFDTVESPHLIVDSATRSPFSTFRHVHRFLPLGKSQALLRDEVTFSLPFWWLGKIWESPVAWDLNRMFAYRHAQTRRLLEA